MSCELDVIDCFDRRVLLQHANWQKHLTGPSRHPEVVAYHDQFPALLQDPDIVVEAERDRHHHFYLRGLASWWLAGRIGTRGKEVWRRPGLNL